MGDAVIDNPTLNSPFEEPTRHWKFDRDRITDEVVDARRVSSYFMPIPKSKRGDGQLQFQAEWTADRIEENRTINHRPRPGGEKVRLIRIRSARGSGGPVCASVTGRVMHASVVETVPPEAHARARRGETRRWVSRSEAKTIPPPPPKAEPLNQSQLRLHRARPLNRLTALVSYDQQRGRSRPRRSGSSRPAGKPADRASTLSWSPRGPPRPCWASTSPEHAPPAAQSLGALVDVSAVFEANPGDWAAPPRPSRHGNLTALGRQESPSPRLLGRAYSVRSV